MKCVKCGTDVSAEHRICYKCGEPLDRGRREESRVIIPGCNAYCSMCGTQLLENALFCHKCGANLKGHHTGPVDRYGKPTTTEVVIEKKPVWMGDGPDPNNRDNLKKTAEQRRLEELEAKRREDERRKRELEERERQLEEERRRRMLPRKDGFMQLFSILFVAGFCLLITGFCGRIMIGRLADEIVESGFFKGLEQDFGSLTTDENSKYIAKEFTVCFLRNDPSRFIKKTTRAAGNGMSFFTDLAEITVGELFNQAQAAFSASSGIWLILHVSAFYVEIMIAGAILAAAFGLCMLLRKSSCKRRDIIVKSGWPAALIVGICWIAVVVIATIYTMNLI